MIRSKVLIVIVGISMLFGYIIPNARSGEIRDMTTQEIVRDMGIGINLGNTFEAGGDWFDRKSVANFEQCWGSPIITEEMIKGYKKSGFGVVRVPANWSNMMLDDYTLHPDFVARVKQVVDWIIKNDMYAIVNIHHEGWISGMPKNKSECLKRYTRFWEQIGAVFQDYGDYLMLESQNEDGVWEEVWNHHSGGDKGKEEAFSYLNEMNQTFVDIVRASGGNNAKRHLLIAGYVTDIVHTCDKLFKMPHDPEKRCAVSVHYYHPFAFTLMEEKSKWGKPQNSWGNKEEVAELNKFMDMMKTGFVDQGIPVIVGEFGAYANGSQRMKNHYMLTVCEAIYSRNMCPILWDTPSEAPDCNYSRKQCKMNNTELMKGFQAIKKNGVGSSISVVSFVESSSSKKGFLHPGILHTKADVQRMRTGVKAGEPPYVEGLKVLTDNPFTDPNWNPRPLETVVRGGHGDCVAQMYIDIHRAYQCTMVWAVTRSKPHGKAACRIMNAWSEKLKTVTGNADRFLAMGIHGYQFASIAEMLRDHPDFNVPQMKKMLREVFFPGNRTFLVGNPDGGKDHNGACITNYWANWDLCNIASVIAIGIFCDDHEIFDLGIEYFKFGAGNGSIYNAIPFCHPGGLGQFQESGRDQGHTLMGIGLLGYICEMAWNQGIDLYGWADNRILKAAEYVSRYNNGYDVPFEMYEWGKGVDCHVDRQYEVSGYGRGHVRPVWEIIYNHYVMRKGMSAPNVEEVVTKHRPEGGTRPGDHGGSFDQFGFGTLFYTRPKSNVSDASLPSGNIKDGQYRFVSCMHGMVLQPQNAATDKPVPIVVAARSKERLQIWLVRHLGGGQYEITNAANKMKLAVNDNSLGIP